jgi:hypothetical protein
MELAPRLWDLMRSWPIFTDDTDRPCPACLEMARQGRECPVRIAAVCHRCRHCEEEIYPYSETGIFRHMFTSHGYRMDGRRFDNQNREIPDDE